MKIIRRPSHGTVAAYLALFIALGGTAYALERGSVTSREIASNAVRGSEIAKGAVKRSEIRTGGVASPEIRTDGVGNREIKRNAVRTDEIANDAVGAAKIADDAVSGLQVRDGSLALADLAQGVASVTFDPPELDPGECASDGALDVTNKQEGDTALVLPGSAEDGWHEDLVLDAYASRGTGDANTISVVVCRQFGTGTVDPGPQPLTVLLFR